MKKIAIVCFAFVLAFIIGRYSVRASAEDKKLACTTSAQLHFANNWDKQCKSEGKEPGCSLDQGKIDSITNVMNQDIAYCGGY